MMYEFLLSEYEKTKWPFYPVEKLMFLGKFDKDEANQLAKDGKIRKRKALNYTLIELLFEKV